MVCQFSAHDGHFKSLFDQIFAKEVSSNLEITITLLTAVPVTMQQFVPSHIAACGTWQC